MVTPKTIAPTPAALPMVRPTDISFRARISILARIWELSEVLQVALLRGANESVR